MNIRQSEKEHFSFGHLGLVLSATVLLLGISWMKNPGLFNVFKSQSSASQFSANLPRYYAYSPPTEFNQPLVAGASTEGQGPMIINEDGSLSPAVEAGDVLGAFIGNKDLNLQAVPVNTIADSNEHFMQYLVQSRDIESNFIDNASFETALASQNQNLIDAQTDKIRSIMERLSQVSTPKSLVRLQQLKILQYKAAIGLLENFTTADNNPELVGGYLSQFLQAQQELDNETAKVKEQIKIDPFTLSPVDFEAGISP